ncbi:ABC transporter permease [Nostoc sp. UHCC 0251]|uniref:ABC transporter permease n=1 Tax=Nostoc sp. UHCC 0251 TaxID=3110240 RepID=UPI002B20B231|nr:ABC transporter permease [Nostoc sp. UHCC 0251]MEA5625949.1 ABC transporter permease [Nostoc sp. UHCC 0251]
MKKQFIQLIDKICNSRFWALFNKEIAQLSHNRQLLVTILITPNILLIMFGFALNPNFQNLKVGITDYSNSSTSRQLVEILNQTDVFVISKYYNSQKEMADALAAGNLTVGITIPPEFTDDIARKHTAQVQVLYNAVDANTASIASNYMSRLVSDYNLRQLNRHSQTVNIALTTGNVQANTFVFYNPGLESSWFIFSGAIGVLFTVVGVQAASSLVVREKEAGTIEALMITPASDTEVILAKIFPLLILLTCNSLVALVIGRLFFNLPFNGALLVYTTIAVLYFWVVICIGVLLACFTKTELQALLSTAFVNPPLVFLAGPFSPISAMPDYMQWLSYLNPLRYFVEACRGILLKGVGFEILWNQALILLIFAVFLMYLSIRQFRQQLN